MDEQADDAGQPKVDPGEVARRWSIELELAEQDHKDYFDDGKKIVARYRGDKEKQRASKRFNILFSNTETLSAALYGRSAKPDVRRRFADRDPVGQQAAEVLERSLIYLDDVGDVDAAIGQGLQDYLLPGRGVVRLEYEPIIEQRAKVDPASGQPILDDDGDEASEEFISDQKIHHRYVYWLDFLCAPARNWSDVSWIAFRHTFSKAELQEELFEAAPESSQLFGEPSEVPLNWTPELGEGRKVPETMKKAEVWEIWDKSRRERVWIVKGYPKPVRIDQDPYGLEAFFPMPEPPVSYPVTGTIVPRAEFETYRDQADDLDEITGRISRLTKAMKRRGVYNQAIKELRRLSSAGDNEFIAVEKWGELAAKGGLEAQFQTEDISGLAKVLGELYGQRDRLVQAIYEISGISDIVRGASDPDETFGAQQLKANFGSQRMKKRQRAIQRWVRDLNRLKVELVVQHFTPQVLSQIANLQVTPEIEQLLRSNALRGYRVDIETDSTVFQDASEQQQERTAMITASTQFIAAWAPILAEKPQLMELAFTYLKFGTAAFPDSREIEDAIDAAQSSLEQAAQQQPPQQQADQVKAQAEQTKAEASVQVATIKAEAETQKAEADMQSNAYDLQATQQRHAFDIEKMHHERVMHAAAVQAQAAMPPVQPQAAPQ